MAKNLITAEIIIPSQWPLARVWLEVSALLGTAPRQIESLEFWPHQIWVKMAEQNARLVSYRPLPLWIEQGLEAIQQCRDRQSLDQLGDIMGVEIRSHSKHYTPAVIEQWRTAWADKAHQLKLEALRQAQEEERLRPLREHQQACQTWCDAWQQILGYCQTLETLESLVPALKSQSQTFADLPEGKNAMELWRNRKHELTQASA